MSEAALAAFNGKGDDEVTRRLLDRINQWFRFSYVLGRPAAADADDAVGEESGIRVSGPFIPEWASAPAKLVLMDGEGLGHTPKSVATLSTHVALQVEEVDSVVLVDNATQPMQAAPVAAMKSIAVSGNAMKLYFLFTHFDQVKGDNLPTFSAREEHVLASVGGIHEPLNPKRKTGHDPSSNSKRSSIFSLTRNWQSMLGLAAPSSTG